MVAKASSNVYSGFIKHIQVEQPETSKSPYLLKHFQQHPECNWTGLKRIDLPYGLSLIDDVNALGNYKMGWAADLALCLFLHDLNKFFRDGKEPWEV